MDIDEAPVSIPAVVFPGADIILEADNGATFHVEKQVLKENSEFFKSMFLVAPAQHNQALQTVSVPLKADVLGYIIGTLYKYRLVGTLGVPFGSIDEAWEYIRGAELLQFEQIEANIKRSLGPTIAKEPNPVRAWAVAVLFGLEKKDRDAAARRYFLSADSCSPLSNLSPPPELKYIFAHQWFWLERKKEKFIESARHKLLLRLRNECRNCQIFANAAVIDLCHSFHPYSIDDMSILAKRADALVAVDPDCYECQRTARERLQGAYIDRRFPTLEDREDEIDDLLEVCFISELLGNSAFAWACH